MTGLTWQLQQELETWLRGDDKLAKIIVEQIRAWRPGQHVIACCHKATHRSTAMIQLLRGATGIEEVVHTGQHTWEARDKTVEWHLEQSPYVSAWISNLT